MSEYCFPRVISLVGKSRTKVHKRVQVSSVNISIDTNLWYEVILSCLFFLDDSITIPLFTL